MSEIQNNRWGEQMKRQTPHIEADAKAMIYCAEQQKSKGFKDLRLSNTNKETKVAGLAHPQCPLFE